MNAVGGLQRKNTICQHMSRELCCGGTVMTSGGRRGLEDLTMPAQVTRIDV